MKLFKGYMAKASQAGDLGTDHSLWDNDCQGCTNKQTHAQHRDHLERST
jgi:hypothetical protein